jgi:hypothetical protein
MIPMRIKTIRMGIKTPKSNFGNRPIPIFFFAIEALL